MMARVTNVNMQLMATCKRPALTNFSSFTKKSLLFSKACPSTASMKAEPPLNHSVISTELILSSDQIPTRRSGNYKPTVWDFKYIQSLNNDYVGEKYIMERFYQIKKEIKEMMNNVEGSEELDKLELIDNLGRLGVSYHFKEEIMQILKSIHQKSEGDSNSAPVESLYSAALKFRLLREHGFDISQDTLNNFKDEDGNFKQSLCKDIKGLLQLYEASFYATETENALKLATRFTKSELKNYVDQNQCSEDNLRTLVCHALELPLHWMMLRLETSWYTNIYETMPNANPLLLELARSDFNIVQATHQEELKNLSRWWKSTCLAEKLPFSRDRLVEDFFWTVGIVFEPQHGHCRTVLTKVIAFIIAIDDVYDVYGTLDELEVFTDAVERWDIKAMDHLPDYMKVCYLSFFNTINEIAYDILKEQGIDVLPYLTKPWADLCKAYLQEARWYNNGYRPTLQEYMDNGWISIAIPVILVHGYFTVTKSITNEALESLSKYPDIIRWTSTIIRFVDDLGTSSHELKRGDVPKSIQCYMEEKGASEEEAREHINMLLKKTWEQMNKEIQSGNSSLFSETFVGIAKNFARTSHCVYQHGDGHGIQNSQIKNNISKILFEPITIPNQIHSLPSTSILK